MATPPAASSGRLAWRRTSVDGHRAVYGDSGGDGPAVLFLHGWALGHHAYKVGLGRLARRGFRVLAPALPGFGGSADLPRASLGFEGYAAWCDGFLTAAGHEGPTFVIGHSFGGGVGIQLAHDFPDRVSRLVLVNAVGTPMAGRTLFSWGMGFRDEALAVGGLRRVVPRVLEDVIPNLARNPVALWRVADLVRRADLGRELDELKRRRLPVVVLWGERDRIIPRQAFEAMCTSLEHPGEVIAGNHSWLLANPDQFGEVITNVLGVTDLLAAQSPEPLPADVGPRSGGRRAAG